MTPEHLIKEEEQSESLETPCTLTKQIQSPLKGISRQGWDNCQCTEEIRESVSLMCEEGSLSGYLGAFQNLLCSVSSSLHIVCSCIMWSAWTYSRSQSKFYMT